jgi:hypothetical protein
MDWIEACRVEKKMDLMGRKSNIGSDFIITGRLNGSIFTEDTLLNKEIRLPCDLEDNWVAGGIF